MELPKRSSAELRRANRGRGADCIEGALWTLLATTNCGPLQRSFIGWPGVRCWCSMGVSPPSGRVGGGAVGVWEWRVCGVLVVHGGV